MLSPLCPVNTLNVTIVILTKLTHVCYNSTFLSFPCVLDNGNLGYSETLLGGEHLVSLE